MQIIGAFFVSVFGSVFTLISAWFASRAALYTALVAVSLAATAGAFLTLKALVVGLITSVSYAPFVMAFFSCWPSNAETCIAACVGADLVVFLYRYKMSLIESVAR